MVGPEHENLEDHPLDDERDHDVVRRAAAALLDVPLWKGWLVTRPDRLL
jgi:hypothetical protein